MIALKHLTPHAAIWYTDAHGAQHSADVLEVKTTLKSWGIVKVKVCPHYNQIPVWIDRKRISRRCD